MYCNIEFFWAWLVSNVSYDSSFTFLWWLWAAIRGLNTTWIKLQTNPFPSLLDFLTRDQCIALLNYWKDKLSSWKVVHEGAVAIINLVNKIILLKVRMEHFGKEFTFVMVWGNSTGRKVLSWEVICYVLFFSLLICYCLDIFLSNPFA